MVDSQEKELMLKFLKKNFPVHRIKHGQRFKRTIVTENESFVLNDKTDTKNLYYKLSDILNVVFNTNKRINHEILNDFLNLRQSYKIVD